jgi:predicted nuclease of predicted toxin-antitoxin system
VNDPFLIDECLSPDLVALAHARGHSATHIVFRTLQGTPDRRLVPIIQRESFVLVTNNGRDFLKLYRQEKIHPGLIIIVPGGIDTDDQLRLFGRALDVIEPAQDLVNKVVEVQLDGSVQVRDWPEPSDKT